MNGADTVLFELGTEELPPLALKSLWIGLWDAAQHRLHSEGLLERQTEHRDADHLFAARRLALKISGVRAEIPSRVESRRGPALKFSFDGRGEPTKALLGFARSCGADEKQIKRWRAGKDCLETGKGVWVTFDQVKPARPAREVLPGIMRQAVADVSLDVHMRWGMGDDKFARPVRWVVLLYGEEVVSGNLMGLRFSRESRGHRFLGSGLAVVDNAESYCSQLRKSNVLVSWDERNRVFTEQIESIERRLLQKYGIKVAVVRRPEAEERNLSSVEWPQAVVGSFDERFLKLPADVVETVLEDQQQCFPIEKRKRKRTLVPHFVAVANLPDKSGCIRIGCERVVQARLQDAEFYLRQDRQRRLEDRVADLERVMFHRKLGTMADRTRRIEKFSVSVAEKIGADCKATRRAAQLCKADLGTDMVQSFPNLQGVMGEYYARLDGEDENVYRAIKEHHHLPPKEPGVDRSAVSLALTLADRLDMLYGVFAVGEIPTGTRDPLGVRRAAREVLALLWDQSDMDVQELIKQAADGYPELKNAEAVVPAVNDYVTDRLRGSAMRNNHLKDEIEAVLAVGWRNPPEMFARLNALHSFRQTTEGVALAEANKRIRNILRKSDVSAEELDSSRLHEPAERDLAEQVAKLRPDVQRLCQARGFAEYHQAMERLSSLAGPVAKFFDDVLVMAEEDEIRHNRLRLLRDVRELFLTIADLSRLQGGPKPS